METEPENSLIEDVLGYFCQMAPCDIVFFLYADNTAILLPSLVMVFTHTQPHSVPYGFRILRPQLLI